MPWLRAACGGLYRSHVELEDSHLRDVTELVLPCLRTPVDNYVLPAPG